MGREILTHVRVTIAENLAIAPIVIRIAIAMMVPLIVVPISVARIETASHPNLALGTIVRDAPTVRSPVHSRAATLSCTSWGRSCQRER